MKATVESISPVKAKLSVEIAPEEVSREEETAFRELRRSVSVPGFRKGKAPLSVLKRLYGDRVRSDVVGRAIERSYYEALAQERIIPVSDADIELQAAGTAGGVAYTAVVEIRPKVEAKGCEGLALKKARAEVGLGEVEARIDALRAERATFEPAPAGHALEAGNMALIDYEGTVGGAAFEGGKGEDRTVVLGTGALIPGFEEGLIGMNVGEERTIGVTFPEDYKSEALAGREAQFRVALKDAKIRRLPEVDDDFAREALGAEGCEQMRARIREGIEAEKRQRADRQLREAAIDALLQANPFEVPDSMVRSQQAFSLERLRRDLSMRGLDADALGLGRPDVQEFHRRAAERSVRWAFLLRAIADKDGLAVSDEDVEERLRAIAASDGRPVEAIRAFFEEGDRLDGLRSHLLETKVLDRVLSQSSVEEVDPAELERKEAAGE